jgi:hypothetical protein
MRTITYSIIDWTDEPEIGGFTIMETEIWHVTTGDEFHRYDIPGWYATRAEARAAVKTLLAAC